MSHRQSGFTLFELLVALTAFGLLMVGLVQGGRLGIAAWRAQDAMGQRATSLEAADRVLRALVTQAHPGTAADPPDFNGLPGGLVFRTTLPLLAPGQPGLSVDAALGLEDGNRLVLRWSPHGATRPVIARDPLISGLDHVEFAYWQEPSAGRPGRWVRTWRDDALPALVRIRLVFPAADRRHWPDIVASPIRERPDNI